LNPGVYAKLLGEFVQKHRVNVWLLNTGWIGGPYGVGERISLPHTRAIIRAILTGKMNSVEFQPHSYFGFMIPKTCPEVPSEVLDPIQTWRKPQEYHQFVCQLVSGFINNFRQFEDIADVSVKEAGPHF